MFWTLQSETHIYNNLLLCFAYSDILACEQILIVSLLADAASDIVYGGRLQFRLTVIRDFGVMCFNIENIFVNRSETKLIGA